MFSSDKQEGKHCGHRESNARSTQTGHRAWPRTTTVVACLEEGRLDLCCWPDDNSDLCATV